MSRLPTGHPWWSALRSRTAAGLREVLQGPIPRATRPVEPLPGALGPPAFRADHAPPGPLVPPPDCWNPADQDPTDLRVAHRHGWFAELARRAANGDAQAGDDAIAGLDGWLRFDLPGQGAGWTHGTDAAVRLVHWAAGFSWLGGSAPAALLAAAAGSAAWHVRTLEATLPLTPNDGHARIAHHVGILVAALTFPAIPDARRAWTEAASALASEVEALTTGDGSDKGGAPAFLAQSAWLTAIAIAVARANGAALPSTATAAWARAVAFLDRLTGDGRLPALGDAPFGDILAVASPSLPTSLRTLAVGWRFDAGEPGAGPDPRAQWFGQATGTTEVGPKGWSVWTFAGDGTTIASMPVRGERLRVILAAGTASAAAHAHEAPLQVLADVGTRPLLADPGTAVRERAAHDGLVLAGFEPRHPRLLVARVDGKKARMEGAASLGRGRRWARDVLLNQQRLRVTDRLEGIGGAVTLTWTLGADWEIDGAACTWTLRAAAHTVGIELPSTLTWRYDPRLRRLVGEGVLPRDTEITCSFELR
ncbi:MAG: hypothetical protein EXR71_06645 [Myxococcales bacterium]|nr:hypothetical protein [Myxococcales bacterium]